MKKRIMGLALCATLLASALVGCGGNTTKTTSDTKTSTANTSQATSTASTKSEAKSETPASTKPEAVTLNVAYMPNYGSLWAIENAIAQGYLISDTLGRVLISFVSTERLQYLHFHTFQTVTLLSEERISRR